MTKDMSKIIKIGFTGDLSFSGYFRGKEREDIISKEVSEFLQENGWTIINLESPITQCGDTEKERLAHKCSTETADFILKNFPNPVASLANNHMMDFGKQGLWDTMECLDKAKIPRIGAGKDNHEAAKPVIIEEDGFKIGIFSFQYKKDGHATTNESGPLHDSETGLIRKTIKWLKGQVDKVVVVYHGGEEFFHTPMPYNRKQLQKYIDWGADAVVAHHPHTVQGYECYKGKYIFYSLGNFIFDTDYQRVQPDSEDGLVLSLELEKGSDQIGFDACPIRINRHSHIIEKRNGEDAYFKDINRLDYQALWSKEALRKGAILASSNSIEPVQRVKLSKTQRIKKEIKDFIQDPAQTKRRAVKKMYMKKGRKMAQGK